MISKITLKNLFWLYIIKIWKTKHWWSLIINYNNLIIIFQAYTGFSFPANKKTIATGNWGCGAFGGSARLKSLLQLMACALSETSMAYFTFGDTELKNDLINMYNFLVRNNVTVGKYFLLFFLLLLNYFFLLLLLLYIFYFLL